MQRSEAFDFDGVPVRSLTLAALIEAKVASDRPKDREHLIELRALQDIAAQQAEALGRRSQGEE